LHVEGCGFSEFDFDVDGLEWLVACFGEDDGVDAGDGD